MDFGFIILRHVNSPNTELLWRTNYTLIKRLYPKHTIVIIDDNSNSKFLINDSIIRQNHDILITSDYPGRGELLPYIYYLKYKWFPKAIILHDSAFLQKKYNFNSIKDSAFLWEFEHNWDNPKKELEYIYKLNNSNELIKYYNQKQLWKGCFGGMTVITLDFLSKINLKHNINLLLPHITSRSDRMCFERIIAVLCSYHNPNIKSIFGNIHKYCRWGITYNEYINDKSKFNKIIYKVWSGR